MKDDSSEIKLTFFHLEADRFFEKIQEGKIYQFSKLKVKNATRWNNTKNRYELDASSLTMIEEAKEENLFKKMDHKIVQI